MKLTELTRLLTQSVTRSDILSVSSERVTKLHGLSHRCVLPYGVAQVAMSLAVVTAALLPALTTALAAPRAFTAM